MSDLQIAINRAKELLQTTRNAAMATVKEDGSPHNTPFHYIIDHERGYLYWASSPQSVHSQNLGRSGQAFIVIYEAAQGGGLYMQAENCHELADDEIMASLELWNDKRHEEGKDSLNADFFTGDSPQRMYCAELVRYWVNNSERDDQGNIVRDTRTEVTRKDLS